MSTSGGYKPFPSSRSWADGFESAVVDQFAALLAQSRLEVSTEAMEASVRVATRYAAVDTGAIEGLYSTNRGFTRTIAEQTATWQAALKEHGEHVERSIEDALSGYEMVLDLVTQSRPLTESWIRQLHETLCSSQETYTVQTGLGPQDQALPKGVYKSMPNNPTSADTGRVFHYAPVEDTPAEMQRLVKELTSGPFAESHPVVQAAYAHYAFVRIHPFADGNGRVARALASIYLYRSPGVPLVIFADQKDAYLDALEAADAGTETTFVQFISERCIDTIELVRSGLDATGEASSAIARLTADLAGRGGLGHDEYDAINRRLGGVLRQSIKTLLTDHGLPPSSTFDLAEQSMSQGAPDGYRVSGAFGGILTLTNRAPVQVRKSYAFGVWSARPDTQGPDFVVSSASVVRPLDIFIRDVHPAETEVLRIKVDNWVRALLDVALADFATAVHDAVVRAGYIADIG